MVAARQSAGRGRQGREWFDGAGNFMGSTVVHIRFGDPEAATLALSASLAVHQAVAKHLSAGTNAMLKWPNDVLIGKAKLAGILLERANNAVIVGIGVNLAQAPVLSGREAVALSDFGRAPERKMFASDLVKLFALEIERWRNYGMDPIVKRWISLAHPLGTQLTVEELGESRLAGEFAGLTDNGALQLRLADGTTRAIHAGDVLLAPDQD